jgi:hypothetical protein
VIVLGIAPHLGFQYFVLEIHKFLHVITKNIGILKLKSLKNNNGLDSDFGFHISFKFLM